MNKVTNELEALEVLKKHQCIVEFRKESYDIPEHVRIKYGIQFDVIGKDLIEAVNRLYDRYHTAPCNEETLVWWNEYIHYYDTKYWRRLSKEQMV